MPDSEYFSVAWFSGWMSVLLMSVVFAFFFIGSLSGIASNQVSAEVLAFVLTLFAAVQVGRMERPDRSTLRGRLAQASNLLIGILILPTVVLAVALAFSRGLLWRTGWAFGCIAFQLLLLGLLWQRQRLDADQENQTSQEPDAGQQNRTPTGLRTQPPTLLRTDPPDYSHAEVLHCTWWRTTTADALLIARAAFGCVVETQRATLLRSFLHSGRPAHDPAPPGAAGWIVVRALGAAAPRGPAAHAANRPCRRMTPTIPLPRARSRACPARAARPRPTGRTGDGEPPASLLDPPANVLALQRSGTIAQSVNVAVFGDQPKADWGAATEEVRPVDLDASPLAPTSDVSAVVNPSPRPAEGHLPAEARRSSGDRRAAGRRERPKSPRGVLEIQLPVPAPSVAYAGLQSTRVQFGLRDGDYARLALFLDDMQALAAGPTVPGLVIGIQTVSEGIPSILNPPLAAANPGPGAERAETGPARLVLASDLDVVAGSGLPRTENASKQTWRLLAICSDWRSAEEIEILDSLDPDLQLAGLTTAILPKGSWSSCCSATGPAARRP